MVQLIEKDNRINHAIGMSLLRGNRGAASDDRQARRQRRRDSAATARKNRRRDFLQQQAGRQAEQNLRGVARVYIQGHGSDAMRHNVTELVHRQAELYSKAAGEPFTTSLERAEGTLLKILVAYDEIEGEER